MARIAFNVEGVKNGRHGRDARLAFLVLKALKRAGFAAQWQDIRTDSGKRLHPVQLVCGQVHILVRSVGYKPAPFSTDALYLRDTPLSYLQCGAADISALLAHLVRYAQGWSRRNPFDER